MQIDHIFTFVVTVLIVHVSSIMVGVLAVTVVFMAMLVAVLYHIINTES